MICSLWLRKMKGGVVQLTATKAVRLMRWPRRPSRPVTSEAVDNVLTLFAGELLWADIFINPVGAAWFLGVCCAIVWAHVLITKKARRR